MRQWQPQESRDGVEYQSQITIGMKRVWRALEAIFSFSTSRHARDESRTLLLSSH